MSRHKDEIKILTQDKQELEKTLIRNDGNQVSASELQNKVKLDNKVKVNTMQKKGSEMQM